MTTIHQKVRLLLRSERGATAVEYGLMVGLIATIVVVSVALLGDNLAGLFGKAASSV